jgi:protein TonB
MQRLFVPFAGRVDSAANPTPALGLHYHPIDPLQHILEEGVLEISSIHQRRNPLDWFASLGIHVTILSVLMILPLYFGSSLDFRKLNLTFLAAPLMPAAAPPPAPLTRTVAPRPHVRAYSAQQLTAPSYIPKAVPMIAEAPGPEESSMGVPGGIPGGEAGGQMGGVLGGLTKGLPSPPPVVVEGPKAPVHVGGAVKPPRMLYGPDPEYPILARQSRLAGTVIIEAIIDEHGNVHGMRVVSGHPLLIPAALNAVSKRKYEPTILDGAPTPIDLRVEISFSFS